MKAVIKSVSPRICEKVTKQHYYVTMGRCKTRNFVIDGQPCTEYTEVYEVAEGVPSEVAIHFGIYDTKEEAEARAAALNLIPHVYWGQGRSLYGVKL